VSDRLAPGRWRLGKPVKQLPNATTLPAAKFIIPNARSFKQQRPLATSSDPVAAQQDPGNILVARALKATLDRARHPGITTRDPPRPKPKAAAPPGGHFHHALIHRTQQ
jgi:hypothetical protein